MSAEPGEPHLSHVLTAPRVVAADLDGTLLPLLLDGSQRLSAATVAAARILGEMGVTVLLVTGRMFRSAAQFAAELGLGGPVVAYQGALIREVASGRVLHHDPLPMDVAHEVIGMVEPRGLTINLYVDDRLCVAQRNADVVRYEEISRMEAQVVGPLRAFLTRPTTKIGVTGEPQVLDALLEEIRSAYGERVSALKTWPFFLELASPTATKAQALQLLGDMMGFGPADVLAFGDSYNDADMLAWAGTGVAVAGGPPEVAATADETCESVDDDGFARYLSRQPWFPAGRLSLPILGGPARA